MKGRKKKESKHKGKAPKDPPGDERSQGGQNVQQDEASQQVMMLQKLKDLPEDEFNSKFEKMLVSH